jgi:amino acid transporter
VAWIAVLTAICYAGIELSSRTQQVLLGTELAILFVFAFMALLKVYAAHAPAGSMPVSLEWFNPLKVGSYDDFLKAFLVAVFIYWGWDTGVAVNEETENPRATPGIAAVTSTFLLVAVYVLCPPQRSPLRGRARFPRTRRVRPTTFSRSSARVCSAPGSTSCSLSPC